MAALGSRKYGSGRHEHNHIYRVTHNWVWLIVVTN